MSHYDQTSSNSKAHRAHRQPELLYSISSLLFRCRSVERHPPIRFLQLCIQASRCPSRSRGQPRLARRPFHHCRFRYRNSRHRLWRRRCLLWRHCLTRGALAQWIDPIVSRCTVAYSSVSYDPHPSPPRLRNHGSQWLDLTPSTNQNHQSDDGSISPSFRAIVGERRAYRRSRIADPPRVTLLPLFPPTLACTRFRRHRVRCFDGTGGVSWRDGSLHESSSLRLCG